MKRSLVLIAAFAMWSAVSGPIGAQAPARTQAATLPSPEAKYDPARDAAADIRLAVAEARKSNRRVILDVGGEWCGWCHTLDRYFVDHKDLAELRDKHFVWLKVNYSQENKNEAVISTYGKILSYPWLFVLEQDGKLLSSQQTDPLEEGPSYNYDRMKGFLTKWIK